MFCNNCGKELHKNTKFCTNCGMAVVNNNANPNNNINLNNNINSNNSVKNISENYGNKSLIFGICSIVFSGVIGVILGILSIIYSKKETVPTKDGNTGKILGIIGIVISIIFGLFLVPVIEVFFEDLISEFGEVEYNDAYGEESNSSVKGNYTREVFSGNSFTYKTLFDTAVFEFDYDSRFEVKYESGQTYIGTYEVYNGANITIKANSIRYDESINGSDQLADDIMKLSDKMMEKEFLNTYLLWIKTDSGVLQPFMIEYNESSKSGTAVNVYAAEQGSFTLN